MSPKEKNSCRSGGAATRTIWIVRGDGLNDAVLEVGRERWSQERRGGIAFYHAIDFCLAINFSRPADGYYCYWYHLCCCGGFLKGVTKKGV